MAVSYLDSTDPRKISANQRALLQQRGDELHQQNQDLANQYGNRADDYNRFLDPLTEEMAAGNGGYRPEEISQIMQSEGAAGNYLTPDEQRAMSGDTSSYDKYFNPEGMSGAQQDSAGLQRNAAQHITSRMNDAIDPTALKQSDEYRARTRGQVADNAHDTWNTIFSGADNVRGAIGDEAGNVRGAIDPSSVQASEGFLQDYNLSPQEKQDMIESAGISAGTGYRAATGEMQRRALAAGSSPMGVAAYRARMERSAAGDAGDAMTKARVAASEEEARRKMAGEQLREQGGRYLTDTRVGSELDLGKQRAGAEQAMGANALAAQQHLGDQALQQKNTEEGNRQTAEQYLTGAKLGAAATGGEAELNAEQGINNQQRQQQQFNTTAGTDITKAQDQTAAARAAQIAQNRQGVGMANQKNASDRATQVANTRVNQQNVGIGAVTNSANTQNANQQGALNRQEQNYGTQAGATNQATAIGAQADAAEKSRPGLFSKIVGGLTGAVGALGGGTGMKALGLADGGVVTKPTYALIGEDGPEVVMPIGDYRARAKTRPSVMQAPARRPMYGEA